jgi:hypothetical protein
VFVPPLDKRSIAGMMTYQQALACLREGTIVGKPSLNEHGHWELELQRYAANRLFSLRVAAEHKGGKVTKIFAFTKVEKI